MFSRIFNGQDAAKKGSRKENRMKNSTTKSAKKTTKGKAVKAAPKAKAVKAVKVVKAVNVTNPYRVGGGYWAAVEALRSLGMGKQHPHAEVLKAVKKMYGASAWSAFEANAKGGKLTADERAILNVAVTARKDYGKPLNEIGLLVQFDGRAKTAGLFKIGK
jgi:hypothetical protein